MNKKVIEALLKIKARKYEKEGMPVKQALDAAANDLADKVKEVDRSMYLANQGDR
jgi:hypothetical protein